MYFFYLIEQHSKFLLHTVQVLYMCTLCDSTDINTIIQFVPHVSGDGLYGGSDLYLQFRDTCGKRRNITSGSIGTSTYSCLKCIVYYRLLKPRQSFRITLYICIKKRETKTKRSTKRQRNKTAMYS